MFDICWILPPDGRCDQSQPRRLWCREYALAVGIAQPQESGLGGVMSKAARSLPPGPFKTMIGFSF
jgi:hypothetical protein